MNTSNWINSRADFGNRFGMGDDLFAPGQEALMDQQIIRQEAEDAEAAYDLQMKIRAEAEVAEAQNDAKFAQQQATDLANQIKNLQGQLVEAQNQGTQTAANIAMSLQSQITELQSSLTTQRSIASEKVAKAQSLMQSLGISSTYTPYLIGGGIILIGLIAWGMSRK